jgi:hypothetical protein
MVVLTWRSSSFQVQNNIIGTSKTSMIFGDMSFVPISSKVVREEEQAHGQKGKR